MGLRRRLALVALVTEPRLVVLRERLEAERADGSTFRAAWKAARTEALAGLPRHEQDAWAGVLKATRSAWRSSYYGGRSSRVSWAMTELEAYAADGELESLGYEPAA